MPVVDVFAEGCMTPLSRGEVRRAVLGMLARAGLDKARVEILLVRDSAMAVANARFMGCAGPTNVLSFPDEAGNPVFGALAKKGTIPPDPCGSLLLSVDTVRREARLFGKKTEDHSLFLLAHGLGHLAGYEHGPEMDYFCSNLLK